MKLKITVHGVAYEVDVEVLDPGEGFPSSASLSQTLDRRTSTRTRSTDQAVAPSPPPGDSPPSTSDGGAVTSPIAGTVTEHKCKPGDTVEKNQVLLIIEAMKMNTSIAAPTAGKIKAIPAAVGDSIREGQVLVEME